MRIAFVLSLGAGALSSCATPIMTAEECRASDWYAAGLEDGALGRMPGAFDARIEACAATEAPPPDAAAYGDGRAAGLSQLCTEPGGFQFGLSGAAYNGVCAKRVEGDFLDGYLVGRRRHGVEAELTVAREEDKSARSRVDYHRTKVRDLFRRIEDPGLSDQAFREIDADLENAREQLVRAERAARTALDVVMRAEIALRNAMATETAWRRGGVFQTLHDQLSAVHDFARAEDAIDHCTDQLKSFAPTCFIAAQKTIADVKTGAVCARGPGEAKLTHFAPVRLAGDTIGWALTFDVYPGASRSGVFGRRSAGSFGAHIDARAGAATAFCLAHAE